MLIFIGLSAGLIIKGALFSKNDELLIVFKQKCHISIHNINTQRKIIGSIGLHKLIIVLLF